MPNFPRVAISILNWNGLSDTLACLESVFALDYPDFEVILVDNSSSDNSVETISKLFPRATVVANEKNLGFTGGNNVAIKKAMENSADYVWLLNNDTVVEPDCLKKLVEYAEANETGLLSPLVFCWNDPRKPQFVGSRINRKRFEFLFPDDFTGPEFQQGTDVCLWGTALLVRRSVIDKIGPLKEEYFAYWEDTEYSLRAMNNGFRTSVCPSARIYHKQDLERLQNGERKPHFYYYMMRNKLLLAREYATTASQKLFFARQFLSTLLYTLAACRKSDSTENVDAALNGVWHGLHGVSGPMGPEGPMPERWKRIFLLFTDTKRNLPAKILRLDMRAIRKLLSRTGA